MKLFKAFVPMILVGVIAGISAFVSKSFGWERYAMLIGVGAGLAWAAFWFSLFQPMVNDYVYLPKIKAQLLPMLRKMAEAVPTALVVDARKSMYDDVIGWWLSVRPDDNTSYSIRLEEKDGRCSAFCIIGTAPNVSRSEFYPGFMSGRMRLDDELRAALEAVYVPVAAKTAERDARLAAILDRVTTITPST